MAIKKTGKGPRKLSQIVRNRLAEIEDKFEAGWTMDSVREALEEELDISINVGSLRGAVSRARKSQNGSVVEASPHRQEQKLTSGKPQPVNEPPKSGEEKKRALAEASRVPIPNLEKYFPKTRCR